MELELRNGSHPPLEMEIDIFRPLNQLSKEGVCLFLVVGEWLSALKGIHSPGCRMSSAFKGVPRPRVSSLEYQRSYLRYQSFNTPLKADSFLQSLKCTSLNEDGHVSSRLIRLRCLSLKKNSQFHVVIGRHCLGGY